MAVMGVMKMFSEEDRGSRVLVRALFPAMQVAVTAAAAPCTAGLGSFSKADKAELISGT